MKRRMTGWIALLLMLLCTAALAEGSDNWLAGVLGGARSERSRRNAMLRCFKSTASFPKMIISTTMSERSMRWMRWRRTNAMTRCCCI